MDSAFKKLLQIFSLMAIPVFIAGTLIDIDEYIAILAGFFLSSIFIMSSFWVITFFEDATTGVFLKAFFIGMFVRFFLILILFAVLIGMTKINKMYFTVSFIISYLSQSVTEMIFLNKRLQKNTDRS